MNLKDLSREELLLIAKKLDIFEAEKMKRHDLENMIAHITDEVAPNKVEKDVVLKKIFHFNWVTAFLFTFLIFDVFSIIVPIVLHFVFIDKCYVESTTYIITMYISYQIHHLYLMLSLNLVSLIWGMYVFYSYIRSGILNTWVVFMAVTTTGYWIYFLLGLHDKVDQINSTIASARLLGPVKYSPIMDDYILLFWVIVGLSSSFVLFGGISFAMALRK